jgi:hypothetical protein
VRALETCDQPLQYAQLRAEPDWKVPLACASACRCGPPALPPCNMPHVDACCQTQAIGARLAKTLGKGMNAAVAAIRSMSFEQISQYEREKAITIDGVEYLEGEIKVRRCAAHQGCVS